MGELKAVVNLAQSTMITPKRFTYAEKLCTEAVFDRMDEPEDADDRRAECDGRAEEPR